MSIQPVAPIASLTLCPNGQASLVWVIEVTCPHCGQTHRHGGGTGLEPLLGPRVPHCQDLTGADYELTVAPATRLGPAERRPEVSR